MDAGEESRENLRDLYASGDFTSASIDKVAVGGGLKILVNAEARAAMGNLEFRGNTVFNSKRLREEVEFRAGEVVDDAKLGKAKRTILDLYKKKGYPDTIITYPRSPEPMATAPSSSMWTKAAAA